MTITRRSFVRLAMAAGLGTVLGACRAREGVAPPPVRSAEGEPAGGMGGSASRYQEAPMLAEQVARGELPPVEERLPATPFVLEVNESIGAYGGAWRRAYRRVAPTGNPELLQVKNGLTQLDRTLTVKPYIAESWEIDESGGKITWHLRPGMRWSNGDPLTSEDFRFYWLAGLKHPGIGHSGLEQRAQIEVIDDYAVSLQVASVSNPFSQPVSYSDQKGDELPLVPAAYAKRYHPDYAEGGLSVLQSLATLGGYASWEHMYRVKVDQGAFYYGEAGTPTLRPWRAAAGRADEGVLLERNPYFWQVDESGQQLPYLDQVVAVPYGGEEPLEARVANGEVDCQVAGLLPQREDQYRLAGYRVQHWPSGEHLVLQFDPSTSNEALGEFVSHRDVRRALSLAISRADLAVLYGDLAEPRQYAPMKESPLYDEDVAKQYTEYDPSRAGQVLDAAGYGDRDAEGYRVGMTGERLKAIIQSPYEPESVGGQVAARVIRDLEAVGLECDYWVREPGEIHANHVARVLDAALMPLGGTLLPSIATVSGFSPVGQGNAWRGTARAPDGHYFAILDELYTEMALEPDLERKNALFREVLAIWKEELPAIGLLGGFQQVCIVKDEFMNVRDGLVYDEVTGYEAFQNPQQFYWERPESHVLTEEEQKNIMFLIETSNQP